MTLCGVSSENTPLFGFYPIELNDGSLTVGQYIGKFVADSDIENIYYGTACYNPDDEYIYLVWMNGSNEFSMYKINPSTFAHTTIALSALKEGASDVSSLTYFANGLLFMFADSALYTVDTSDGTVTLITDNNTYDLYNYTNTIAYYDDVLYAAGEGAKLITINTETGETQTVEDKQFLSLEADERTIYAIDNLCVFNDVLYCVAYLNWTPVLCTINVDEFTITPVDSNIIDDNIDDLIVSPFSGSITSIGMSTPEYFDSQAYYGTSGGQVILYLLKTLASPDLTAEDLHIEWTLYSSFPDSVDWVAMESIEFGVSDDTNYHKIMMDIPTEGSLMLRVRLANDDSGNWYYAQED